MTCSCPIFEHLPRTVCAMFDVCNDGWSVCELLRGAWLCTRAGVCARHSLCCEYAAQSCKSCNQYSYYWKLSQKILTHKRRPIGSNNFTGIIGSMGSSGCKRPNWFNVTMWHSGFIWHNGIVVHSGSIGLTWVVPSGTVVPRSGVLPWITVALSSTRTCYRSTVVPWILVAQCW